MAISAYIGVPGSGKSHECVKNVIIPNILKGRYIVTNIDGINPDAIIDYCLEQNPKMTRDELGTVITVTDEQVKKPNFFPSKKEGEEGYDGSDSFIVPGQLICLDEVWRFWSSDKDLSPEHRSFIAEHRHFSNPETGHTTDLVLMNQSLDSVARFIKTRIETVFRMTKLTAVGLKSRYRVDVFNGVKLFKSTRVTHYQAKYDKKIFPLYNSYNGGVGNESTVDERQSMFNKPSLRPLAFLVVVMLCCGIYFAWDFFHPKPDNSNRVSHASTDNKTKVENNASPVSTPIHAPLNKPVETLSQIWRISGTLTQDDINYIVLVNSTGDIRLENKSTFHGKGLMLFGIIDGQKVTYFSGKPL